MREISTDILVVGGGSAGCFAAISAARTGANVLLVEKNGMLGGTTTSGMVNFPGLFHAWGKRIIGGPAWESIERCVEQGGAVLPPFPYKSEYHYKQQILVDIFTYTCILDEMCVESGVDLLFHSMIFSVKETETGIEATIATKGEAVRVFAKLLIDSTGDADALRLGGCEYKISPVTQPATLINDIAGYDFNLIDEKKFRRYIEECYSNGEITKEDFQGQDVYERLRKKRIQMHILAEAAHTSEGKTRLEISARRTLKKIIRCLSKFEGLENIRVAKCGYECGVRETVRIVGEEEMTATQYLSGELRADAVCYAFYPIDLHRSVDIKQVFLKDGTIPCVCYGNLVPKGAKRMLVAGRCISSDTDANSALRVQATCMATGQVAGVAAALCARDGTDVKSISLTDLKNGLRDIGAIVPGDEL